MIKRDLLAPTRFLVALFTARAQLAFVRIIFFVAARAIGRELVSIEISGMARVALQGRMLAPKREFGRFVMIE